MGLASWLWRRIAEVFFSFSHIKGVKADGILNRSCWLELLQDFKELATGDIADMDRCYDSEGYSCLVRAILR